MIKVKSIEFPGYYHSIAVISTRFSGKETTIKTEKNMYGNGCIIQDGNPRPNNTNSKVQDSVAHTPQMETVLTG